MKEIRVLAEPVTTEVARVQEIGIKMEPMLPEGAEALLLQILFFVQMLYTHKAFILAQDI